MRLDWFLPAVRKSRDETPVYQRGWYYRIRSFLPHRLASNHHTKQRGGIRRFLRWLGPSWLQSPLRRLSQTLCFVTFCLLFFCVCWPYTARPNQATFNSAGWRLSQFDPSTGLLELTGAGDNLGKNTPVYVVDANTNETLGVFLQQNVESDSARISLTPDTLTDEVIDRVELSSGSYLLTDQPSNAWPNHYTVELARKEFLPSDFFLTIDPLVSLSTAIAARQWVWSLGCAAGILLLCVFIPRGFCGYVCPLGTLIDVFDWSIGRQVKSLRLASDGWWVHIKYYLLAGSLLCAVGGVLVTGYVAAIPVVTRGFLMIGEPIQSGLMRGWHLVPAPTIGSFFSMALFAVVLALGLLQPRFWCKYVCPSGALFSLGNLLRAAERKVESSCIHCNKCIEVCPFDAIKPDFTTRATDCTLCQTCGGVCPTHAIKFVERGNRIELKLANDPPTGETSLGRRGFLSLAAGSAAAVVGAAAVTATTKSFGANLQDAETWLPIRPPGSVPEQEFLQMCIRCGECFKACPNNVLQPMSFQQGLEGLWTPFVVADWAGCESSCNGCGQVCPTGAIRALPLEEKRHARMGLAIVNQETCLPLANREACQLCVDECNAAGYEAIEFMQVHTDLDENGNPVEESGYLAPLVDAAKCVGCGLCQTRCYGINVEERKVLLNSAIIIEAGNDYEDRFFDGSYAKAAAKRQADETPDSESDVQFYVPESVDAPKEDDGDNPFGL